RSACNIRDWAEMAELIRIDHGVYRLDKAIGDLKLDDADNTSFGVVEHGARLAVDPGKPGGDAEDRDSAEQAEDHPRDALASGDRLPECLRLASAIPVQHDVRREHPEKRLHVASCGGIEEPAGQVLTLGSPCLGRHDIRRLPRGGDAPLGTREDLPAVHL